MLFQYAYDAAQGYHGEEIETATHDFTAGTYLKDGGKNTCKFHRFFRPVDGVHEPLSLFHEDWERISEPDREKLPHLNLREATECTRSMIVNPFKTDRTVADKRRMFSYEGALSISQAGMDEFLAKCAGIMRVTRLSILDFGCGQGMALKRFLDNGVCDAEMSVGVTLPHAREFADGVENNIVLANLMHLAAKHRFDILFEIYGGILHHPLNRLINGIYGMLHALSFVREGGMIASECLNRYNVYGEERLEKMGILERVPDLMVKRAKRVVRKPTVEEVYELLMRNSRR